VEKVSNNHAALTDAHCGSFRICSVLQITYEINNGESISSKNAVLPILRL